GGGGGAGRGGGPRGGGAGQATRSTGPRRGGRGGAGCPASSSRVGAGSGNRREDVLHDVGRGHLRGPQFGLEDEAMREGGDGHGLHVVGQHEFSPAQGGEPAGKLEEGQRPAGRGAAGEPV